MFAHFARAWPDAPVYTSLYNPALADLVAPQRVRTSFLQRLPLHDQYFRFLAPLYPTAFEHFDLSAFDTVLSSTTAWAKGVIVRPGATHVCYINTVSRFAFNYERYVGGFGVARLAAPLVQRLVAWDKRAAARPSAFVANSRNVAQRVKTYYGRDAYVLHCPVDVERFKVGRGAGDYFIIASRLLAYKRIDLAIAAANAARVRLYVAGTGPAEAALRAQAAGTTTTMLGYVEDARLDELMGNAIAAILPGEEDFGLVPLEAAAAGRPTIAFRGGGALETILEGTTGAFFDEPTPASLAAVLQSFDGRAFAPERLRAHAERFAPERFIARLRDIVEEVRHDAR